MEKLLFKEFSFEILSCLTVLRLSCLLVVVIENSSVQRKETILSFIKFLNFSDSSCFFMLAEAKSPQFAFLLIFFFSNFPLD